MSEFIDGLLKDIDARLDELAPVLWEAWELQRARAALLDREIPLAVEPPPHRPKLQLPSERKDEEVGGAKSEEAPKAEAPTPLPVGVADARDYVQGLGRPFSTGDLILHFGVDRGRAQRVLNSLSARGMIERPAGSPTTGRGARWEFVKPSGNGSPKKAPRSSPPPSTRPAAAPVPLTGRPMGPPSKPGQLKRAQAKGRKISHKPVKGVRV